MHTNFNLEQTKRVELVKNILDHLEIQYNDSRSRQATPTIDRKELISTIKKIDLDSPSPHHHLATVLNIIKQLGDGMVHTTHPMYYGLFNPRPNIGGILADVISAYMNPQMAAWSHAPFAAEVETHLITELGKKFGYAEQAVSGTFGAGGAEANLTAMLCALAKRFPDYLKSGVRSLKGTPIAYTSAEAHHSLVRAVRVAGLGSDALRDVPTHDNLKINIKQLEATIKADLAAGHIPFMVAGTAGTTGTGVVDDLEGLADLCRRYNLWFHVDAAYGGASVLSAQARLQLMGIEQSDSITFDIHKWMSVPMATSTFITRHKQILSQTFAISTNYMPVDGNDDGVIDPFMQSLQWSRRFIGLKLLVSLAMFGWKGYEELVDKHLRLGDLLRKLLLEHGWKIYNKTHLPVVCFSDEQDSDNGSNSKAILDHVLASGKAWASIYLVQEVSCIRACIINYDTETEDVHAFVELLKSARTSVNA